MKQPEYRREEVGDEERGNTEKEHEVEQGEYRNEDERKRRTRKYIETASAAETLRAYPERFLSLSKGGPKAQSKDAAPPR
ncbi:MAG: hypothetical protein K2P88_00165 [Chitinophagaceae bacterium]|nr:hypothetical protein [Chitinophagaceae bacterium]